MTATTLHDGPPAPLVTGLVQTAIGSENPGKLAEFYQRALGLDLLFEAGGMYFLGAGVVRFMIGPKPADTPLGGDAAFYFEPTVWSAAEPSVEQAGASFLSPAIVLQRAEGRELVLRAFKDPEGHTLALLGWRASH